MSAISGGGGGAGGYGLVDQNGVALTARTTLNITSRLALAQDNSGASRTDLLIGDYHVMAYEWDHFLSGNTSSGAVGKLGWASAANVALVNPVAGHPGIFQISTNTTSGVFSYLYIRNATAGWFANDLWDVICVGRLNTNDANTTMRIGMISGVGATPSDGIFIEKQDADTSWFGNNRSGSADHRTAALATIDTGWHTFRVRRIDASTAGFTVDANAEVTLTTSIPGATGMFFAHQIVNSANANKSFDVDFADLLILGLNNV